MYIKNIIGTLFSKGFIVIFNFLLVILTTNLWGSTGRGVASLIIADVSILAIVNNVFAGGCVNYFTPKIGFELLVLPAFIWTLLMSLLGSFIFVLLQPESSLYTLLLLTIFNSLFALNQLYFTSFQDFKKFNLYGLLLPILTIGFLSFFEFIIKLHSVNSYLYGYIVSLFILWVFSLYNISKKIKFKSIKINFASIIDTFKYGYQNELSYFIHFLNYRLSYFLILHYIGIKSLGVYSIGIAMAEAIWIIAQSISTVQYTHIVNNITDNNGIEITKSSARISLYFSLFAAFIVLILPGSFFHYIFGKDFGQVKNISLLLFPGVISMAVSNIYGHYFSATGKTKVLIIKSFIGLAITLISFPILIPIIGIYGACIVSSVSYIGSSIYLTIKFYNKVKYTFQDFYLRKTDFTNF
jgi:O-antigen/teichoic acid export membrane protein